MADPLRLTLEEAAAEAVQGIVEDERLNPWKRALIEWHVASFTLTDDTSTDADASLGVALETTAREALDPAISAEARALSRPAVGRDDLLVALEALLNQLTVDDLRGRLGDAVYTAEAAIKRAKGEA